MAAPPRLPSSFKNSLVKFFVQCCQGGPGSLALGSKDLLRSPVLPFPGWEPWKRQSLPPESWLLHLKVTPRLGLNQNPLSHECSKHTKGGSWHLHVLQKSRWHLLMQGSPKWIPRKDLRSRSLGCPWFYFNGHSSSYKWMGFMFMAVIFVLKTWM